MDGQSLHDLDSKWLTIGCVPVFSNADTACFLLVALVLMPLHLTLLELNCQNSDT